MKVSDSPQAWFWPRVAEHRGVYQPRQHLGQMEPAVEVVPRRGGVASGMTALLVGLTAPNRGALDVGQYPIDKARSWCFAGSTKTFGHQYGMRGGHPYNAQSKPVRRGIPRLLATGAIATLRQTKHRRRCAPVPDCMARVIQDCIGLNGHHRRLLSRRSAVGLAAVALTAEASVVAQTTRRLAFGDGLHDFVLDRPRRVAGRIPMKRPLQHRQVSLGRRGKMRGQGPCGQGSGMP